MDEHELNAAPAEDAGANDEQALIEAAGVGLLQRGGGVMRKVLQRHKDNVLQIIREHDGGISFNRLRDKVSLVTEAVENCIGALRSEALIVVYQGKFYDARSFNWRNRTKEDDRPVPSTRKAESGSKQAKKKAAEALQEQTVGGVDMLDYKLRLLRELVRHFGLAGQKSIGDDLAHIHDDLERLARDAEAKAEEHKEAA